MQVSRDSALAVAGEFEEDFRLKLKLNVNDDKIEGKLPMEDHDEEDEDEEEEFSFVCMNPDGSPISADDIFHDGQILPFYPLFDKNLRQQLEKVFVEDRDGDGDGDSSVSSSEDTEGAYCPWTKKPVEESDKACRKSNSTGFSKLRRFRELIHRSRSDGKDAFVFLHHDHHHHHGGRNVPDSSVIAKVTTANKAEKSEKGTDGKNTKKPPRSAHERLYVQNRATKEEHKRKSYLPYRVGFFTTNVHPY